MKKVLIIGAGQLGSRHLQALKAVKEPLQIWVSDPSQDSLKVAKERYEAITAGTTHPIEYSTQTGSGNWDLVIVATSSNVRRTVVEQLLKSSTVKYMVLEKVLFDRPEDYPEIERITSESKVQVWVNCCMRQMPIYQKIRETLKGQPFSFHVTGSQYGLITNSIHYLDYMAWVAGDTHFTIDTKGLNQEPFPSKRKGFFEIDGTLGAYFKNGSSGAMTCYSKGTAPILVEIHSPTHRFLVRESERKCWMATAENQWAWTEIEASIPYQSQLTTEVANQLFDKGTCVLTPLKESSEIHLSLFEPLRKHLNQKSYPFT